MLLLYWSGAALGIVDYLRRRFARVKLGAHLLKASSESFNLFLLPCGSRSTPASSSSLVEFPRCRVRVAWEAGISPRCCPPSDRRSSRTAPYWSKALATSYV